MSRFHVIPYEDRAEIDLSPMLDVVFILLIFFIVVASFIREDGISVALPEGLALRPLDFRTIEVAIDAGSTFTINGSVVARESVRDYVRALHGENPDADYVVVVGIGSKVKDTAVAADAGRNIGHDVVMLQQPSP